MTRNDIEHMFAPSRRAAQPSALRLAEALPAIPSAADVRRHAEHLRRLAAIPDDAPLLDLDAVCAIVGVEAQPAMLRGAAGGIEAALAPLPGNRFAVSVDAEPRGGWARFDPVIRARLEPQRYRFRVAHEIGHTLFYLRSGDRPRRRFPVSRREEVFCDRFAQALLLPDCVVASDVATPARLLELQERYDVSLEMCARAFAELHGGLLVALLIAKDVSPPSLRPQWVAPVGLPPRWWTDEWLQRALTHPASVDRLGLIGSGARALRCLWRGLPHRRQVLLTALPAR